MIRGRSPLVNNRWLNDWPTDYKKVTKCINCKETKMTEYSKTDIGWICKDCDIKLGARKK